MLCFKNGKYVEHVSLSDRAFQYGDGCFTTACVQDGRIQLLSRHLERLNKASAALMLQFDQSILLDTLNILFQKEFSQAQGTLKVLISRGEGQRGYGFSPTNIADVYVFFFPSDACIAKYSVLHESDILENRIGLTMPHLVGVKSLNRLEQVILKAEATKRGLNEALVLDIHDRIVEGISSNCFLLLNGEWVTPDLRYNGVHGIMRAEILDRMVQFNIPHAIRDIDMSEIKDIEALFYCNALHPMQAVHTLNRQCLNVEITKQLFNTLNLDQM